MLAFCFVILYKTWSAYLIAFGFVVLGSFQDEIVAGFNKQRRKELW